METAGSPSNSSKESLNSEVNENMAASNMIAPIVTDDAEAVYEAEEATKGFVKLSFRERVFLIFSEPSYSTAAYCLSFYFDGLVALSMVLMCSETVVAWSRTAQQQAMWRIMEMILTINFLVDFLVKIFTARPLIQYILTRPTFTIDVLGLLPFFTERLVERFSGDEASSIKALRVLRLLRFFRLSRIAYENFPDVRMFIQAVRRSKLAIAFLGMYVFGAGLFFASCIYFAETSECSLDVDGIWYYPNRVGEDKEACSIQNMFGAWWFTLVTMTTVGYGDTNVNSSWGRILTVMIMISSLVFLALPSAIFAANLTEMYLERRLMKKMHHGPPMSSQEKRPTSPISSILNQTSNFFSGTKTTRSAANLMTPTTQEAEIENLLVSVEAAGEQVQAALSTLSTHLTFIHHQQHQLQALLSEKHKKFK
jgi:hypothetical protein